MYHVIISRMQEMSCQYYKSTIESLTDFLLIKSLLRNKNNLSKFSFWNTYTVLRIITVHIDQFITPFLKRYFKNIYVQLILLYQD